MVKFSTYVATSAVSVLAMVCHAVRTRQQFYLVMFYLAHSRISLALLVNMGLVIMCLCWQLMSTVFLGTLREAEVERLTEHCWREAMEILFAMTVFRDELNLRFVFWVSVLLFVKTYHWLGQKRVEYLETTPSMERLSHVRLCTFMALLLTFDCLSFHRSFSHLLKTRQPSVSLFFAFEYAILTTTTITTCIKYALHMREMLCEERSTGKDVYVFYVELVQDLLQLSMYLLFFLVIFIHYGLPLHLVRELYETFQNFKTRVADFLRYRRLTSNMNDRFQDPTPEDISRDPTCIICREEMVEAKKLPCGHLFHIHCLRLWLERQHTCPTCRAPLLGPEDESEDPYDHDVALDFPQHEEVENDLVGDEYANLSEQDQTTNDVSRENGSNWAQLPASTSISTTQHCQTFAYLAFTNGTTLWYPLFVPMFSGHLAGQVYPSALVASGGEPYTPPGLASLVPGHENNGEQNNPSIAKVSTTENAHINQWSYMPRILQIHQNSNQGRWDAMPSKELNSSSTHGTSPSTTMHEGVMENERATSSTSASQSLAQIVTWNLGRLNASRYEEQNAYLERVVQVLKGQLQSAIDLQHELHVIQAGGRREEESSPVTREEESSPPMEVLPNSGSKTSEQNVVQEISSSNFHKSNNDIDSRSKTVVQHVKDHCEHCPTQSTTNLPGY